MKQICELCEAAVATGSVERDPVLAAHLAECAGCREFAEFQAEVLAVPPVVPDSMPALAEILAERARRQEMRRNSIRLIAWPLSLAAAAMLAVAGVRFALFAEPAPVPESAPVAVTQIAELNGESQNDELWNIDALNLSWDQANPYENALAALRQDNSSWNIEVYNPIEEELEI